MPKALGKALSALDSQMVSAVMDRLEQPGQDLGMCTSMLEILDAWPPCLTTTQEQVYSLIAQPDGKNDLHKHFPERASAVGKGAVHSGKISCLRVCCPEELV